MMSQKIDRVSDNLDLNIREILGIPIFGGAKREVLSRAVEVLGSKDNKVRLFTTLNPEHVMAAIKDPKYMELLRKSHLNIIDGIALVWAGEVLNKEGVVSRLVEGLRVGMGVLRGRYVDRVVPGSSLMEDLVKMAESKGSRVYLLGGWEDRAEKTAKYFEAKYKKLKIRYCLGRPKYKNEEVLKKIAEFRPDILLVAYGMKSQEMWIGENLEKLGKSGVKLAMGVGRSFDYYSGDLKRAPVGWRRMGLEWLYSLIREPKRLRRQLEIPKFLWRVVCYDVLD